MTGPGDVGHKLSKTLYLSSLQCLKRVFLDLSGSKTQYSASDQFIFKQGHAVGELARESYPGGILILREGSTRSSRIQKTQELIKNESVKTIFEAAFEWNGVLAEVDILKRNEDGRTWEMIEVKGGTEAKPENLKDVGLQLHVLRESGIDVRTVRLMHVNPDCVFPHLEDFFVETDVTYFAERHARKIPEAIRRIREGLSKGRPDIDIGTQCFEPRPCEYWNACRKEKGVPVPSVLDLPGIGDEAWKYYRSGKSAPSALNADDFSGVQRRALETYQSGKEYVDSSGIRVSLSTWKWPLYFLDFETIGTAIPRFEGLRPYNPLPFQFSCHIQDSPGAKLSHAEYLHQDGSDPSVKLAEALLGCIGAKGSVVAYFKSVEAKCLEILSERVPKHAKKLKAIRERLVDPLPVLRQHVYHPGFNGSFSLKAVAPTLCGKQFEYATLEVGDGMSAQVAFEEMMSSSIDEKRKKTLRSQLLEYCCQDTKALASVVDWLHKNSSAPASE